MSGRRVRTPNAQRRGSALLWSVAALGLAIALAPLYVSLCGSLASLSSRGAHRLTATQVGERELDRVRAGGSRALTSRRFAVPELPSGRGSTTVTPAAAGMKQVEVTLTWTERSHPGRAEWTTLVRDTETRRH